MILDIDVGNTRVKWRAQSEEVCETGSYARLEQAILPAAVPQQVRVSSVAGTNYEDSLSALMIKRWGVQPWFARTPAQALGLRNSYSQPELLGVDRWLAMLAAWRQHGGPLCVVDAGSALTIDVVDAEGNHLGGYIIPGREAMKKALLGGTDRVRFDAEMSAQLQPGVNTAEAVGNGALLTAVAAVERVVQSTEKSAGIRPTVVVCGGDGERLFDVLSLQSLYQPDLVFDGLALAAGAP